MSALLVACNRSPEPIAPGPITPVAPIQKIQTNSGTPEVSQQVAPGEPQKESPEHAIRNNIGMANPASTNCIDKGGKLEMRKDLSGGEYGVCLFEDNRQCEEWALMRGDCPAGGLKITGYDNDAEIYCAITGGTVKMDKKPITCELPASMGECDVDAYYTKGTGCVTQQTIDTGAIDPINPRTDTINSPIATPNPHPQPLVGGQKDAHGCCIGCGYSWCANLGKCVPPGDSSCETK